MKNIGIFYLKIFIFFFFFFFVVKFSIHLIRDVFVMIFIFVFATVFNFTTAGWAAHSMTVQSYFFSRSLVPGLTRLQLGSSWLYQWFSFTLTSNL